MDNLIKAFLPNPNKTIHKNYTQLQSVLDAANVTTYVNPDEISNANCAIHLIGNEYCISELHTDITEEQYWLQKSFEHKKQNNNFRIFIWQPEILPGQEIAPKQTEFINSIRNSLVQDMAFCNHVSPVMFVEDLRSIIYEEEPVSYDTKSSDIFFIQNEIDEENGNDIVELLSDILKVVKLNLSLRTQMDYSGYIAQQIKKSKLTVIYFSHTGNWALPFIQQIWKNTGGASANKTIVFIGDTEYEQNKKIIFDAENVINISTSKELVPLEIKVLYDKTFS